MIHFAWQGGFRTTSPSIYHPWDLQHQRLPQFFTARQRAERDLLYSAMARRGTTVCVPTKWGKRDVVARLGLSEEKVMVVPVDAPTAAYAPSSAVVVERVRTSLNELGIPETFWFYPAQTWAHKNHSRLFAALALLRNAALGYPSCARATETSSSS